MKIQKLKQSRFAKLRVLIALLLLAGVGSYFVITSRAESFNVNEYREYGKSAYTNATLPGVPEDNSTAVVNGRMKFIAPANSTIDGKIYLYTRYNPDIPEDYPTVSSKSQFYLYLSYDTGVANFTGSQCVWQYGCMVKTGNDLITTTAERNSSMIHNREVMGLHQAQVLYCFNIPPNARFDKTLAATYQFKRTNTPQYDNLDPTKLSATYLRAVSWKLFAKGSLQGGCESNPDFKNIWVFLSGTSSSCDDSPVICDRGSDPGAKNATLTGFGNGGNGNGGEGSGNNGVGSGPGAGSGGGGGGSSANKQANKPNSLPSPSPQGQNEQTELDPDPFFDGKSFEKGSDTDNLVFGNSTIGGKKVPKLFLYILSATLLGGAGGALWWRWKQK